MLVWIRKISSSDICILLKYFYLETVCGNYSGKSSVYRNDVYSTKYCTVGLSVWYASGCKFLGINLVSTNSNIFSVDLMLKMQLLTAY